MYSVQMYSVQMQEIHTSLQLTQQRVTLKETQIPILLLLLLLLLIW